MPDLNGTIFGRLMIAFAILFGLSFYPAGPSSSHEPMASVHAQEPASDIADHGHSHFDGDEQADAEAAPDPHEHKHNPADHAHETVHGLPMLVTLSFVAPRNRVAIRNEQPIHGLSISLDRPPRPSDIA